MVATSARPTPRNILLAMGSSRGDERALKRAFQLTKQWNASLTILHVVAGSADGQTHTTDEIRDLMSREVPAHPEYNGIHSELQVADGDPVEQILIKSKQLNSDMIVMGVGHHDNLRKKLLGSTIDRVIRAATVPVLSVRSQAFATYESVLILTDFSPASQRALDTAIALSSWSIAAVLHVCDAMPTVMAEDKLEALKEELSVKLTDAVDQAMKASSGSTAITDSRIVKALEFGVPIDVIERHVADRQPHLVVVGTHGRTGFLRAVLGSVAERLLSLLPSDVLVVGSPQKTQ